MDLKGVKEGDTIILHSHKLQWDKAARSNVSVWEPVRWAVDRVGKKYLYLVRYENGWINHEIAVIATGFIKNDHYAGAKRSEAFTLEGWEKRDRLQQAKDQLRLRGINTHLFSLESRADMGLIFAIHDAVEAYYAAESKRLRQIKKLVDRVEK